VNDAASRARLNRIQKEALYNQVAHEGSRGLSQNRVSVVSVKRFVESSATLSRCSTMRSR